MKTTTFLLAASVLVAGCGSLEPIGAATSVDAGDAGPSSATADASTADSGELTSDCTGSDMKYLGAPGGGGGVARPDGIIPALPVDYLSVRLDSLPQGAVAIQSRAYEERGTACASATNVPVCTAALAALRSENDPKQCASPHWGGSCGEPYLAYTRGDEVGTIRTKAEALAFFGTIDTPKEAYWLAWRFEANLYPQCNALPIASSRMIGDAIEIVVVESGCLEPEFEVLLRVYHDGRTEIVERKPLGTKGLCV